MKFSVVTIFPEYLEPLRQSLLGRAIEDGLLSVEVHDLREQAFDRHRTVDDSPYGGGAGMVMKPDVWGRALDAWAPPGSTLVVPTPAGRPFTQDVAAELAGAEHLVFACGRYEGIDQRVVQEASTRLPVHELSIGDYVLAGGEAAVLVMVEAVARLLPGVLGNPMSAVTDSFGTGSPGLLEYPSYTRPAEYRGLPVPPVLLSGNHAAVDRWRRDESLRRTARHRPDLIAALDPSSLDERDRAVLAEADAGAGAGDAAAGAGGDQADPIG
ncbi:tRNA (guanosine(37)-N1)-methyltransferase TrmD [Nakamurella sp. YIM 132087]|uniref:tRNA (guanine-N(1)-)-methyltransferase n=1 Tax=Nakamurella alba TaxID=2665158 RepID=A0A7K1FV16_9ACTN|nr:tRNA (guanosine(37)-N1)-methyltransferase TrmD [Nakamurella alba]MTD16674.1 tRNA (guanosine(37)-N1)-methyltransferase TrmD [Nakamurella alba]